MLAPRPVGAGVPPPAFDPAWLTPYLDRGVGARARAELLAGRPKRAIPLLRRILADKKAPQRRQAQYLLAHALLRAGEPAAAATQFAALEQSYPLLRNYHRYHRARALGRAGKDGEALKVLATVDRDTPLRFSVTLLRARLLSGLGRHDEAAPLYREVISRRPTGKVAARAHLALGLHAERTAPARGKERREALGKALAHYRAVLVRFPLSAQAGPAEKRVKALLRAEPSLPRALSAEQRYTRAMRLYWAHRNQQSERALAALIKERKQLKLSAALRCKAAYYRAKSVFKQRQRDRAEPLFGAAVAACRAAKETDFVVKAMYNRARGYSRKAQFDQAAAQFGAIEKEFSRHSYADDARLRAAEVRTEQGKDAEARKLLASLPERYPGGDMVREALWRVAWADYLAGKRAEALKTLERVIGELGRAKIYYAHGRALYWKARILVEQKKTKEATAVYEEVIRRYPLSYYALQAFNRLREGAPARFRALVAELLAPVGKKAGTWRFGRRALFGRPAFLRGVELARLGFGRSAARELAVAGVKVAAGAAPQDLWLAAVLYHRARLWHLSHRVPRVHDRDYRWTYPLADNLRRWTISYPRAFPTLVRAQAEAAKVPPELTWAVMREESGFSTAVESWANAVGLMQLILPTARAVGRQHKLEVRRALLHDPAVNIKLGATYLGFLLRGFQGTVPLAISGYNAGEGATYRWVKKRGKEDLDRFLEQIPYDQTRRYTKRVLSSFFTYHVLYGSGGAGRVPRIGQTIPKVSLDDLRRKRRKKPGKAQKKAGKAQKKPGKAK